MVEVKLDPLDPFFADKNTYVSMRVGEVQKLGRASTSRSYTFSQKVVGDRKYGKIDIFKRVGTCTVGIVPESDFDQVVNIPLDNMSSAKFKVTLNSFGEKPPRSSVDIPASVQDKKSSDVNSKVLAAKTYLERHRLELRLSEAMQEVIRFEPEDPCAYIAEKLTKAGNMVSYLPKDAGAEQASPIPPSAVENLPKISEEPVPPPKSLLASSPPAPIEAPASLESPPEAAILPASPIARRSYQDLQDMLSNAAYWERPFYLRPSTNTWMRRRLKAPRDFVISDVTTSVQSKSNLGEVSEAPVPTLGEFAAMIGTTGDADLFAAVKNLSVDLRRQLIGAAECAISDVTTSVQSKSNLGELSEAPVPTLGEFAAMIGTTGDADLFATVKNLSVDLRRQLIGAAECSALLR